MEPISLPERTYDSSQRARLVEVAHESIRCGLERGSATVLDLGDFDEVLCEKRASFVTLRLESALRGCIGSLEATRPLVEDVAENAFRAAFHDPRFAPLGEAEFREIEIHLSVLSPLSEFPVDREEDLLEQLRPHRDGLLIVDGAQRGTFLPAVWESLPEPHRFVAELKRKAGLPVDHWSPSMKIYRYTVELIP